MKHKSMKDLNPEQKNEAMRLILINQLERQMKKTLKELKSMKPAVIKAERKYERLVQRYNMTKQYFDSYVKKRDSLFLELTKSELNKQGV